MRKEDKEFCSHARGGKPSLFLPPPFSFVHEFCGAFHDSELLNTCLHLSFSSSKMEIANAQSVHSDSTLTWLQVWALMTFLSGVGLQLYLCWIPIRSCAQCCGRAPTSTTQVKVQQTPAPLDSRAQQGRQWVWGRNNLYLQYQPNETSIEQASRYPQEALGLAKLLRRRRH